ncbi:MAG TPA: ribbon-helix-helix domain-containing protein [Candidatus Saccharimonadales bacterium]|nr:ribbon-helix-helix domain-containing protein [Candidatus Saccharimonadales bacterium]
MNTQTLNIALPEDLVKKVDELATKEFRNRSELIREALRSYIKNSEKWEELYSYGKSVAKKLKITTEEEVANVVADYRHEKKSV